MGEYQWTVSPCRSNIWVYNESDRGGAYYEKVGYPYHGVFGGLFTFWRSKGGECFSPQPPVGAPVGDYGWQPLMNYGQGEWGQPFENAIIGYGSEQGQPASWHIMYGNYGQGQGFAESMPASVPPADAPKPPDHEALLRPSAPPEMSHR